MIRYLGEGFLLTFIQILVLLGPGLLLAYIMHILSESLRKYAGRLFGQRVYIGLTVPGIMIHELGHAFFCVVFGHRIVDMRLFRPGRNGTLGQVKHAYNPKSRFQRIGNFFIGTGPIWFGAGVIYLLSIYLVTPAVFAPIQDISHKLGSLSSGASMLAAVTGIIGALGNVSMGLLNSAHPGGWRIYAFIYLVFCIGSHVTLSGPDLKGASQGLLTLVGTLLMLNWLTLWLGDFSSRLCQSIVQCSGTFYSVMLFALMLNVLVLISILLLLLVMRFAQSMLNLR